MRPISRVVDVSINAVSGLWWTPAKPLPSTMTLPCAAWPPSVTKPSPVTRRCTRMAETTRQAA